MKGAWDRERDPLAALQSGEPGPFEAFVEAESGTFLAYFRRLGAGPSEAEDLAQETFLKLYESAAHYRPERRFAPFAFRIARNAWIDRRRRLGASRIRRAESLETEASRWEDRVASTGDAPSARLEREDESRRVAAALARLSEAHRAVFELGVMQELGYEEISALLEIPVGTVKSRMFHAVRRLRESLVRSEDQSGLPRDEDRTA